MTARLAAAIGKKAAAISFWRTQAD